MMKNRFSAAPALTVVLLVLIPLLFLTAVELALIALDYGFKTDPFQPVESISGMYRDNTAMLRKYHPGIREDLSTSLRNRFQMPKPVGTLRGFVVGGSTAPGYPFESNHGFHKIVESALDLGTSYNRVGILNMGYSAMTSYYVRDTVQKFFNIIRILS